MKIETTFNSKYNLLRKGSSVQLISNNFVAELVLHIFVDTLKSTLYIENIFMHIVRLLRLNYSTKFRKCI